MPSPTRRARNLLLRLVKGLPPHSHAVSPEIDDDLFETHLALYQFAARFAAGHRVLDLGCGTGYGAATLAAAGATEVLGIDLDTKAVGYARRRYASLPGVRFRQADAAQPLAETAGYDLAVAVNLLAQAADAAAIVRNAAASLQPEGMLVASVPPILDAQTMELHRRLPNQRSNLYLWDWEDLFRSRFANLRLFRQLPPPGASLDLGDSAPATARAADFVCEEIRLADLYDAGSLTAIWVVSGPLR